MISLNSPPTVVEGMRMLLDECVSYKRAWGFLKVLVELIVLAYPTMYPGLRLGIMTDNYQATRSWSRQRAGQKNTSDTNELLQAFIWMVIVVEDLPINLSLSQLGINQKAWASLRAEDFSISSMQPIFGEVLKELTLTGGKGQAFVQRKLEKLSYRLNREQYPKETFSAPSWGRVFPSVAEGEGLAYRVPAVWKPLTCRVGKILLNNTQQVYQTGIAHATLCRWLGIGTAATCRDWLVAYGDWGLQSTHLRACVMLQSTLNRLLGRPGGKTANAAPASAFDDGDAPAPVAAPVHAVDESAPTERTKEAALIWCRVVPRRSLALMRSVCKSWGLDRLSQNRKSELQRGAGLTGKTGSDLNISRMSSEDLERVLAFRGKELEQLAADPAQAARAAPPPKESTADRQRQYGAAIELQSIPAIAPVARPEWTPLRSEALRVLSSTEARLGSMQEQFEAELKGARTSMSDRQRLRFGHRWLEVVGQRLQHMIAVDGEQAQEHVADRMIHYYLAAVSAPSPEVAAACRAKSLNLSARLRSKELQLGALHGQLRQIPTWRAACVADLEGDLPMDVDATPADAIPADAIPANDADADDADDPDPDPDPRAFPDLKNVHQLLGPLHFFKMGLLGCIFKIYWHYLLAHLAHNVLGHKYISIQAKNFFTCDELFYHVSEALLTQMITAFRKHPLGRNSGQLDQHSDISADSDQFVKWLSEGIDSGDVPFRFYSGFVFGVGLLYRMARKGVSSRDVLLLFALLLPVSGLYRMTGKHNMKIQAFLSMAKILTSPPEISRYLLANWCLSLSGRPHKALGADEVLEHMIGRVKRRAGKIWNAMNAKVHSALNFWLNDVRTHVSTLVREVASSKPNAGRAPHAHANITKMSTELEPLDLFTVPHSGPRTELPALLVTKEAKPLPTAWILPVRFDRHDPTMAAYENGTALAQDFLETCGVVPPRATTGVPEEQALPQGDSNVLLCGKCNKAHAPPALTCRDCELSGCASCVISFEDETVADAPHFLCRGCSGLDEAEAAESAARARAVERGDVPDFDFDIEAADTDSFDCD